MPYGQGIELPYGQRLAMPDDYLRIAINWFINRTPLVTRLRRVPVGGRAVQLVGCDYRPRSTTLGAAVADGAATTITLTDASFLMNGDVLEFATGEQVEITADPNTTANTVTVRRGSGGSTPAAQSNGTTVYLVGNSRTGGEVDQLAKTFRSTPTSQYPQTFQHPYQVGGSTNAKKNLVLHPGVATPLEQNQMLGMQECLEDMEYSSFYGKGEQTNGTTITRPKQIGLRSLLTTNNVTSPTNASAYKPSDLIRDTTQRCIAAGGEPDTMFVSIDWGAGFAAWGVPLQALDAGTTDFGVPIRILHAPFLSGVNIIPAPFLRAGTIVCCNEKEIRWGDVRELFDKPRGSRGDAFEGDIIAEGCVLVDNEKHHAWLSGVTGWAKEA